MLLSKPLSLLPLALLSLPVVTATLDLDFDYVVVGGGTAGVTIASRLAENKDNRVALVEAGTYYELTWPLGAIPATAFIPVGSDPKGLYPPAEWNFVTEPQPGANDRQIHFTRGKCLGGSSVFNFMIYQRPTVESMQQWADEVDDDSYLWENTLPYYKKTVTFNPPIPAERTPKNATVNYNPDAFLEGDSGEVQVSYATFANSFSTWMQKGMQALGLKEAKDFNSGSLMGHQYCASTIDAKFKTRSSSQTAFLSKPPPSNLKLFTSSLGKRILFDDKKTAVGVEVADPVGFKFNLTAAKEVIVSAGTFQSPQLLMVSGVGPAEQLQEIGVPVVADLPGVGQNMWDHPFVGLTHRVNMETFTRVVNNWLILGLQFLNFAGVQEGPLGSPLSDFLGWEKIPQKLRSLFSTQTQNELDQFPSDWPDVEYISGAGYLGNFSNVFTGQPKDGYQYASILGVHITPTSRGNITLKSADTSDKPLINPNWLSTKTDQEAMVAIFKRLREAFQSKEMQPLSIGEEYYPGLKTSSDEDILQYVKDNVMTLWHPACTCKMGKAEDKTAVVDKEAKVFGVQGLRVVDASAFPFLPPGHPQSTVCK
ncbi:hypothetical protein AJ79_01672 [Helicocarpus griseus UAMH5409]|uniref:Glucose-methanol-choline oxidoreductase N-terminal domain-containing protein n=1 Tax=Helicocarpus griseus UAMH5409 TaxID=1447875 RepID=A0A2B7Y518_9EURO|nr:hypothetical protein AJ79_01672 [Helicocarpus griseus UAMH5409]